ncbi:unnamed protein product [Rhizoctonia solani]|uniref:Uncharacterized protein n=1 Tax=Rhizoctonia solani TaxID=456999 RepID=A0A8H2ZYW1_9AGAM|nr:unnamed protein product [Rhizoctonia solani]
MVNTYANTIAVVIGPSLLIWLGYRWLWPKPIPAIPHNPITSLWGDIPAIVKAAKEDKVSLVEFLSNMGKRHGPICQVMFGNRAAVIISDKGEMKRILVEEKVTDQHKRVNQMFATVIPNSQVALPANEKWRRHRRLTAPSMSRRYLERMSVRISTGASDLVKLWGAKLDTVGSCAFEAGLDIQLAAMETIVNITMGRPLGYVESTRAALMLEHSQIKDGVASIARLEAAPLYDAINTMMKSMHGAFTSVFPSVYAFVSCYASPSWRKQYNSISSFLNEAVTEARERDNTANENGTMLATDADCVLDMIIQREALEGVEKFEKGEILDELMMYLFAGQDTTASALRWLVKYLPSDPEIQRRLHEEICNSFDQDGTPSGSLDFGLLDDSERMPVLEAVVAETLRCAGVGSLIGRELLQDEVILGRLVPKGENLRFIFSRPPF